MFCLFSCLGKTWLSRLYIDVYMPICCKTGILHNFIHVHNHYSLHMGFVYLGVPVERPDIKAPWVDLGINFCFSNRRPWVVNELVNVAGTIVSGTVGR